MNSRKYLISVGLAMGAALGAAGIAAATTSSSNPPAPVEMSQTPAVAAEPQSADDSTDAVETQSENTSTDEANGVDCENGIIAATGAECDGGPSANSTDDKNEANEVQTNEDGSVDSGVNGG